MQYVSSTPATRLDVITLQEKLDQQLQQRQVRLKHATPAALCNAVAAQGLQWQQVTWLAFACSCGCAWSPSPE